MPYLCRRRTTKTSRRSGAPVAKISRLASFRYNSYLCLSSGRCDPGETLFAQGCCLSPEWPCTSPGVCVSLNTSMRRQLCQCLDAVYAHCSSSPLEDWLCNAVPMRSQRPTAARIASKQAGSKKECGTVSVQSPRAGRAKHPGLTPFLFQC